MNYVRDYQVLRPIDVDSIVADEKELQQETGPAHGTQFQGGRKNQDELERSACWGRAQVYMSKPKPDSDVAKRYKEICKIPVEQLLGDGEIEVDDFDADLFKEPLETSNPIKPQAFTLKPRQLNTYDTDLLFSSKPEEDYTPTGENFFANNDNDYIDEYDDLSEYDSPQEINQEAA